MNTLLTLLSVDTTFFTVLDYPMSYIEFFGTLANLACVWLIAKKNILSWPIGIIAVLLFGALFYQINLYADLLEQGYYFVTGIIGWYAWHTSRKKNARTKKTDILVGTNSPRDNIELGIIAVLGTVLLATIMSNIHIWLPRLFPEPASLVWLDAFTTVLSFIAQYLLIKKRVENWAIWIFVDVIAIWLYWYKGVPFVALLYFLFLCIATNGLITWIKTLKSQRTA